MNELHFQPVGAALGEGAAIRIGRCTEETPAGETHIYFEPCESIKSVRVSQSLPDSEGRMLDVTLTVQNVCPGRRVFIGLSAHEVMEGGAEELRGFRALSLPAHHDGSAHAVDAPSVHSARGGERRQPRGAAPAFRPARLCPLCGSGGM